MKRNDEIFGPTPASFTDRVQSTLAGLEDNAMNDSRNKRIRPVYRAALIAAVSAVLLAGTALAVALHTDFFHSAYGTGVKSQDAFSVELVDENGEVMKTESYPAVERVEPDAEAAGALVGDYVVSAGRSVELCGYTFTVRDYVIDQNGIGSITVDVENPDGLHIKVSDQYNALEGEFIPFTMGVQTEDNQYLDTRELRDADSTTDTQTRYVIYIAGGAAGGNGLIVRFSAWDGTFDEALAQELANGQVFPNYDETELFLPTASTVPVRELSGSGFTAELSAVGLTIRRPGGETIDPSDVSFNERYIVVSYADGSEYVVIGDGVYNEAVAFAGGNTHWHAFNRLVDAENVKSVTLSGYDYTSETDFTATLTSPAFS